MIAHPDCTFLTVSGARWMRQEWRQEAQLSALHFVKSLWRFPIPRIAIENPVGRLSSLWCGPDQIVQPWQFGDGETKAWCLWLKNLPQLTPTDVVEGREARVWRMAPGPERKRERSRTPKGIAAAIAEQWGSLPAIEDRASPPTTLAERVSDARNEMAAWSDERKANVQLEGSG